MTRQAAAVALIVCGLAPVASAQKGPALGDILRAAATYFAAYAQRLQTVLADESYLQLETSGGTTRITRRLASDVAFVGAGTGVAFYRDVRSIDGKSVREDASRFLKLFQPPTHESLSRAVQLTQEGGRYYVSPRLQVFDELLAPLALLREENQAKATFKLEGIKRSGAADVATVHFAEMTRTHVINSPIDEPATGTGTSDSRGQFLNQRESLEASATYAKFRTLSR